MLKAFLGKISLSKFTEDQSGVVACAVDMAYTAINELYIKGIKMCDSHPKTRVVDPLKF
jgi:hypothetical protein